ncbi:hypothetical protein KC906_03740 [Candidatus Kaiserbacteria bacterium]|nr:hypothetical protein [Candidatus Kaiserbacteria bacterium]MCB9812513.1 hypothetical protein [Candidatus Nomurabacteria bacterium]
MKPLRDQKQLDEMRKRLYDRGASVEQANRHQLADTPVDVARDWGARPTPPPPVAQAAPQSTQAAAVPPTPSPSELPVAEPHRPRRYRSFILIGSILIFILVAAVSSLHIYFGGNQISNQNIHILVQGQPLIGGGEVMNLQVSVSNQNSVPIESATLILKYPPGTRSVGDSPRNLFEERIPLNDIAPEGLQTVPVRIVVFGEENTEREIQATIEYRVNGSNGMFYKDADPLAFRISSSPLVLRVDSIEKVASGQLVELTLTAVSNANAPLEDILITADYPNGFTFEASEPAPEYGENVWRIDSIQPESSTEIKLQGIVSGLTDESFRINFSAGPVDPNNQYQVGAALAEAKADFTIERPFIDVDIAINGNKTRSVVLPEAAESDVVVSITNTLDETVYDMVVEVVPDGNALQEDSITGSNGFYDSNTDTVRWEVSNNESFDRVLPGDSRSLTFSIEPNSNRTTASFNIVVNVYARRIAESSAQETLVGTVRAEAKYSSSITMGSQVGYGNGQFLDVGPVPPAIGQSTSYTITLVASAGANDISNGIVETSLPIYVNWLDTYDGEGDVTYNSVSKKLIWEVGNLSQGRQKQVSFQVDLQPSVSQVGTIPVLLNKQFFKANDKFTGALLQDEALAVTTELSTELGFQRGNGEVVR